MTTHNAFVLFIVSSLASISIVGGQGRCPPLLAGLMPSNAANVIGEYGRAGTLGIGGASAVLEFPPPCNGGDKYPGRVSFDVKHYGGEAVKIFTMQIDIDEQQRLQDHRRDLERKRPRTAKLMTEAVPGGTVIYFDFTRECTETSGTESKASLVGVGHTQNTAIDIAVDGWMTGPAARAVAVEILGKFVRAKFD